MLKTFVKIQTLFADRIDRDDEGATMIEYGLMVTGVAVVVGASAALLGGRIDTMFDGIVP